MPGIQAGEIGPKVHGAMASVDNGWARFNRVRVPRSHMLSRFAQVDPVDGGRYIKPPHAKVRLEHASGRQKRRLTLTRLEAELRRHDLHPQPDDR